MTAALTEGAVGKRLFAFLLPILAGNILQQLYNSADAVIIGRFAGEGGLAAIGASQPIVAIIVALLIGMGAGGEILIGRSVGLGDRDMTHTTVDTLFTGIMILSVILAVLGYAGSRMLLELIHTPPEILNGATAYLRIIMLGIPGIAGYNTLSGMIRATGNSAVPLFFLAVASGLNIGLDLWTVTVLGMGVEGAAGSTVAAESVSFLLCWVFVNRSRGTILRYDPRHLRFSWSMLGAGARCGIPASIQQGAMSVGMLLLQIVVNGMGTAAVTAFTIGSRIDSFAALPITNISQALAIFTSQNLSAGRQDRVREAKHLSLAWAYGISVALLLLLWGFGAGLARFFGAQGVTVKMTEAYVRILSLGYFVASYFTVVQGLIRGTGNTFTPMVISILGYWLIRLPAAALLRGPLGYLGVWSSILIGWVFSFAATLFYYHSRRFQRTLAQWGQGEE